MDQGGDVYDARAVYITWAVLGLGGGALYLEWRRRKNAPQLQDAQTFQPLEEEIAAAMAEAGGEQAAAGGAAFPGQRL